MRRSLKSRLLAGMIGSMVVLLIIFSFVIYHSISHTLFRQFDTSLRSAAHMLSASVEQDQNKLGLEFDVRMMPEFAEGAKAGYFEFSRSDGTVIAKSPSLGGGELVKFGSLKEQSAVRSFTMEDGQPVRAVIVNFLPRSEEKADPNALEAPQSLTLVVAKDATRLLAQLRFLQYLLVLTSIGIISVACAIAAVVVKQGLKPLNTLAAQIDTIGEATLSSRIAGDSLPVEIIPIQKQLNSLLARLEASFERERAFNADVAHELRTPLAGIRSIIDVTLTRVRDAAEYRTALTECLEISTKMQAMVGNLLTLAKVESGQMAFGREQVRVSDLVDSCWRPFSDKAAQAGLAFENKIGPDLVCESDAAGLSMVVSNLLDNAIEYTNRGGRIWVVARTSDTGVEIIFNNTGSQLTAEQAADVFQCFWRADSARSGTGIHCGLGLALVKRIVEALGGQVHAEATSGLFSVHIALPQKKAK